MYVGFFFIRFYHQVNLLVITYIFTKVIYFYIFFILCVCVNIYIYSKLIFSNITSCIEILDLFVICCHIGASRKIHLQIVF